ncbi:MAG: hypothetical protein A3J85_01600 [Desulfobacula sp. RIFOXYA12_FULL_46_16]|nr:MAG: hypothetical protein A3J85_01600 [Desulfobacula sp. RIFOXYA12_FULL_46_16]
MIAPDGGAQFYQYKDQNGALVYTDDLSKIPVDQRESAKRYNSSQNKNSSEEKTKAAPPGEIKTLNPDPASEDFDARREVLYKENEALTKEKDQLLRERKLINSPATQDAYNQKVNQLNERIEDYKLRVKEFNIKAGQ